MGLPQPKPMHRFLPNFQGMFTPRGSRADKVLMDIWQQLLPWQHFQDFLVLNFVDVPRPKPLHGFSPNFQGMITPQEDLELIRFLGVSGNNCCNGNTFKCHGHGL